MAQRHAFVAILVLVSMSGCGGDEPAAPTTPVVVATPTPTPAPTPTPIVYGQGLACGLPAKPECGQTDGPPEGSPPGVYGCCRAEAGGGQWAPEIWDAINQLQREQPSLFDGDRVLDREKYQLGVARILEQKYGVCAKPGAPGDEVAIKNSNDFSEQYDIYLSSARIRYPGYQVTCRPARF